MKTATAIFVCSKCDAQSPKWTGQCLECGGWGTVAPAGQVLKRGSSGVRKNTMQAAPGKVERFGDIKDEMTKRAPIGIGEIDRVFGGGVVPGSVTLIGGEPGIGKSTICLQIATVLSGAGKVVYASGEESGAQVKARAERIGSPGDGLLFLGETEVETIIATLHREKPCVPPKFRQSPVRSAPSAAQPPSWCSLPKLAASP